jgi:hypothetical protein
MCLQVTVVFFLDEVTLVLHVDGAIDGSFESFYKSGTGFVICIASLFFLCFFFEQDFFLVSFFPEDAWDESPTWLPSCRIFLVSTR